MAKVLLPERLWFSEALLMTCGFEQPDVVAAKLLWSEQLLVELPLPPRWTQELLAEKHVTRCQVRSPNLPGVQLPLGVHSSSMCWG